MGEHLPQNCSAVRAEASVLEHRVPLKLHLEAVKIFTGKGKCQSRAALGCGWGELGGTLRKAEPPKSARVHPSSVYTTSPLTGRDYTTRPTPWSRRFLREFEAWG